MISSAQMHPQLAFFFRRDYCDRSDSSLSCSFSPQGLLRPPGFISILLFCTAGIISAARIHLYLALFFRRDDSCRPDSSLSCSFSPQRLFRPLGFILILLFSSAGIIATARIHLYLALFHHRDYFRRPDSSLSCFFSAGLNRKKFISSETADHSLGGKAFHHDPCDFLQYIIPIADCSCLSRICFRTISLVEVSMLTRSTTMPS